MPSMTSYKQGDILLVRFPFTDLSSTKQRPAVVVSGNEYNRLHLDIILAPITTQIRHAPDEVEPASWQQAGLLKPSAVKPILTTFDMQLVIRKLGALVEADRTKMMTLFAQILDLS